MKDDFGEFDRLAPAGYNATLPHGENYGIKRIAGLTPINRNYLCQPKEGPVRLVQRLGRASQYEEQGAQDFP